MEGEHKVPALNLNVCSIFNMQAKATKLYDPGLSITEPDHQFPVLLLVFKPPSSCICWLPPLCIFQLQNIARCCAVFPFFFPLPSPPLQPPVHLPRPTQHCAIFRNRKNVKRREPTNTGSGRFKPPVPPPPLHCILLSLTFNH